MDTITGKQFKLCPHDPIELDENYVSIESPTKLKNITLWPNQELDLAAILDIENKRYLVLPNSNKILNNNFTSLSTHNIVVETKGCVLASKLGSGKTITILALILTKPIPTFIRQHVSTRYTSSKLHERYNDGFKTEIHIRFNKILRPNVIIVRKGIILQWLHAINTFTNLSVLVIADKYDLKEFENIYKKGRVNEYDIILVKAGQISSKFDQDSNNQTKSIMGILSNICLGCIWSRIIYDDYDKLDLPYDAHILNGGFNIFISSTKNRCVTIKNSKYNNIEDILRSYIYFNIKDLYEDIILYSNFCVKTSSIFVDKCLNLPKIKFFKYIYANPSDNYIRLIGNMGEDAKIISEMINGDAIDTAAQALGIKSYNVCDIFQKILNKQYDSFIKSNNSITLIDNIKKLDKHEFKSYSNEEINKIIKCIKKGKNPKINYVSNKLIECLDEILADCITIRNESSNAINRVKENIKEGECQVCCNNLSDCQAVFIIRCCGIILCDECGMKGTQIKKSYNNNTFKGVCPNCRADINPKIDLIYVDKDFNINKFLETNIPENEIDEEPLEKITEQPEDKVNLSDVIKNPKLKALLDIIQNKRPENIQNIEVNMSNLIHGSEYKDNDNQHKKILIFANFSETIEIINEFLHKYKIKFHKLQGNYRQLFDTINVFQHDDTVALLINSTNNCAGMNIQFASDLIFFHKIMDMSIYGQVLGRIQRPGRISSALVHYLLYQNENF